jgi:predicted ATPase
MAILIKATAEKKIIISGTTLELTEVYGRIRFVGDYSGNTIEGEVATFANMATFEEGKMIYTDVPIGNYKANLEPTEVQSLETAHKYAKIAYEQLGYEVIIDMV